MTPQERNKYYEEQKKIEDEKFRKKQEEYNKEVFEREQRRNEEERKRREKEGCFITTATTIALNKNDDCVELNTFRNFRDTFVVTNHPQDVQEYYEKAPSIVEAINNLPSANVFYASLWENYLKVAYSAILKGQKKNAYDIYKETVIGLEKQFLQN